MAYKFNPFTSTFDLVEAATVGTYSSTPVANGATVAGTAFSLHRANGTFPGILDPSDYTSFTGKQDASAKGAANGYASLDANALVPVTQLPPAALERLVIVADQTARFALTTATVQNGDTVLQNDTQVMYFVKDDTNLGNSSGYAVYSAGTASAVAWSGITGMPASVSNLLGTNTGDITLASVGSSPAAAGASLSGQVLTLQPADATNPGVITTGTQTIAGDKTLSGQLIVGDPGTESTGINVNGVTYQSSFKVSDIDGTNFAQNILHRHSTVLEPLVIGARANSDTTAHVSVTAGQNVFTMLGAGYVSNNYKLFGSISVAASSLGTLSSTSAPGKIVINTTADAAVAPTLHVTFDSDKSTVFVGTVAGSNLSGTNTGNVSLAAVGSSPDANGATLSGQVLTLQPADATHPGVVTTGTQTFAGAKTFSSTITGTTSGNVVKSTGDIAETSFTIADNQVSAANVTGLAFANGVVRAFEAMVSILKGGNYELFQLRGIQTAADWYLNVTSMGDTVGVVFTITSAGQVQYTSTSTGGNGTAKFRAQTTSL